MLNKHEIEELNKTTSEIISKYKHNGGSLVLFLSSDGIDMSRHLNIEIYKKDFKKYVKHVLELLCEVNEEEFKETIFKFWYRKSYRKSINFNARAEMPHRKKGNISMKSEVCLNRVKSAINNLKCGFVWDNTQQGHEYWKNVIDNLEKILEGK